MVRALTQLQYGLSSSRSLMTDVPTKSGKMTRKNTRDAEEVDSKLFLASSVCCGEQNSRVEKCAPSSNLPT
jgi:hypothetical protein